MLAKDASIHTIQGLAALVCTMASKFRRASVKPIFRSAIAQLNLLSWVLMQPYDIAVRVAAVVVPHRHVYMRGQDGHFRCHVPSVGHPFYILFYADTCGTAS